MAHSGNSRNTHTPEIGTEDRSLPASGAEPAQGLPERSIVYRLDHSVLGYDEHWLFHRNWSVVGAWWRKLRGSHRLSSDRAVYIEDHRDIEVTKDELPYGVHAATYRLNEEFLKLGFCDFRYGRYVDPFHRLEIIHFYAVHPERSAVLRMSRRRGIDDHTLDQAIEITTMFPDGSILTTTNGSPSERALNDEKRQVNKDAGPGELWSSHLEALASIPTPPKATRNAEVAWVLTNEVESKRVRFNVARGYYAKPTAEECADEALRLLHRLGNAQVAEPKKEAYRWAGRSYFSMPQLGGAVALAIALCIVSADAEPSHSMPPLTASQKRKLSQKGQVKAPARLPRSSPVNLRGLK